MRSRHREARRAAGRRLGVTLCAFAAGALLPGACGPPQPVPPAELASRLDRLDKPNIVLIFCDTLRADWTTPYGRPGTTPELARWTERGVVFERVRSQSSWTKVSMASTLTSLWPRSHGIVDSTDGLSSKATTLAEAFRDAGYRTFGVQTNGWLEQSFGFQQGFQLYLFPHGRGAVGLEQPSIWPHGERVREEFRLILGDQHPGEPFFIYLHLMDVHEYAAPPEYKQYGASSAGAYLAAVRWVDDVLRDVREIVEESAYADDTLLVFGSDHGEAFGENRRYGHAKNVLTTVLNVPLLMRFPFPIEPVRVPSQVRNIDIGPTLLDLAGVPVPESFEGESLVPLILSPEARSDRPSFASLRERLFRDAALQESVMQGRWTYARNLTEEGEPDGELLFDRRVDPHEAVNVARMEPEQTARMRNLLEQHLAAKPEAAVVEEDVRINPDIANRLRAMGYLQGPPATEDPSRGPADPPPASPKATSGPPAGGS